MPPICDIIDSSGPAMVLASSGSDDAHTVAICSATGSHSRFQVSRVLSTQSLGVQAAVLRGARGQCSHAVQPGLGQADGVGDRVAGGSRDRRDEPDRVRRQLAGQVVVHRPGGVTAGHSGAGAAEHLAELGEDLAQVGHVEVAAEAAQTERVGRPRAGIGVLGAMVTGFVSVRIVSGREPERHVSHAHNGTHRLSATRDPPSRSE